MINNNKIKSKTEVLLAISELGSLWMETSIFSLLIIIMYLKAVIITKVRRQRIIKPIPKQRRKFPIALTSYEVFATNVVAL